MGSKVQKKGGDSFLSVLSSTLPTSRLCCLQPEPSLPRHSPPLSHPFLSMVARLQRGEVQLAVFLKQDFFALKQTSFSKDSFTNDAVKNICFCKFKRIQINFFWVFVKKEISSKPRVASQGMLQDAGMAPGCVLQELCSEKISGDCLICTFCALLNFELCFFLLSTNQGFVCFKFHSFMPPLKNFLSRKRVRALDLWWRVFQGPRTGNRMSKPSASTRPRIPFSPLGAKGEGDRQTWDCFHLCVCVQCCDKLTEKDQWLLTLELSKQWVCAKQSSAKPTFCPRSLMQLSGRYL